MRKTPHNKQKEIQHRLNYAKSLTMMRITTTVRPTCSDGIRNQGEEEADCGGPCRPCAKSSEDVVACLSSKVTALYMRDDNVCIQCKAIRNYFGSSIARINIVDCDEEDNEEECEDMLQEAKDQGKLRGYPTWNLYGELYPAAGVEKIKALSGCL